jgi:hypothetical protein
MAKDPEDNFLDLGRMLKQLQDRDPALFTDVWQKTDIKRRKAYYLAKVARTFDPLPIPRSRLKAIGWTKLELVSRHINEQNWQELIELAENTPSKQLEKVLNGEKPITNAHCVLMYFTPKQYQQLEDALLKRGGEKSGRGILHKEEAIMRLIADAEHTA